MKTRIFRSTAAAMIAVAAVLATCVAAGETVTAEPDALLDYIEATGEQYIDTGVNAETGLKASIDFAWADQNLSGLDWSLLDVCTDNSSDANKRSRFFMCHLYDRDGTARPFFAYGLKQRRNPANSVSFVGGQRCEIITDMSSTNSFELIQNGVNTFDATDRETFATNGIVNLHLNLFVFATNYGGRPDWKGQGKLYEMKIFKKNDTTGEFDLLRHYLPCIKDNRAGLYDEVNGTISFSAGSTNFIAGSVTNMFNAVKPAWAEQADDVKFWKWVYEKSVSDYASTDYTEQYLLNVAPSATPAELRIDGIEMAEGGATIRVTATAGGAAVDLSQINGVLCVEAGDALDALTPMAIPAANVTYSAGAELKITGGSLELIGDTATYDGNTYTIASGFGTITSAWINTCVSGQAEGTNVRYEVRYDDTSVRVSVICDEESHPEPNPEPNPMPVPVP